MSQTMHCGPLRSHQHGSLRRGDIKISDPIPIPREGHGGPGPQALCASEYPSMSSLRQSQSSAVSVRRQTYSHNPQDSVSTTASRNSNMHRRRGSALKTVMRKIFGRGRQRSLEDDGEEHAVDESHITIDADGKPMPDGGPVVTVPESMRSKRSPPLANKHFWHTSGLHPLSEEMGPARRQLRRRATLPSLVLSDEEARDVVAAVASSGVAALGTRTMLEAGQRVEEDRRRSIIQAKRRSRSASALREEARRHQMSPIQWRRRSDEIRLWRASVLEGSSTRPQTSTTVGSARDVGPRDVPESIAETEPESAAFNFENVLEMQKDESVTLDQRVITLEVKLMDLELAIAKMQGQGSKASDKKRRKPPPLRGPAPHEHGPPSSLPSAGDSELSSRSSPSVADGLRPNSTCTLRPNTVHTIHHVPTWLTPSSASLPDLNGVSIEQYSALITLLRREQTARKNLENQVSQLQDTIRQLQRVVLTSGGAYAIPSPDVQEVLRFRRAMGPPSVDSSSRDEEEEEAPADYPDGDARSARSDIYGGEEPEHRSNMDLGQRNQIPGMI
ncbi:hypothetical protein VTN02DRAFT_5534 [Thermoascus thermophilus]